MSTCHLPPPPPLRLLLFVLLFTLPYLLPCSSATTYSGRLIHRFSEEARLLSGGGGAASRLWPEKRSREYYEVLVGYDLRRVGGPKYRLLFPSQGSKTMSFGNDFG